MGASLGGYRLLGAASCLPDSTKCGSTRRARGTTMGTSCLSRKAPSTWRSRPRCVGAAVSRGGQGGKHIQAGLRLTVTSRPAGATGARRPLPLDRQYLSMSCCGGQSLGPLSRSGMKAGASWNDAHHLRTCPRSSSTLLSRWPGVKKARCLGSRQGSAKVAFSPPAPLAGAWFGTWQWLRGVGGCTPGLTWARTE